MNKEELRKELNGMKSKDQNVKQYIKSYEDITGISLRSSKISPKQLEDCIMFCVNSQLAKEREERNKIGGII